MTNDSFIIQDYKIEKICEVAEINFSLLNFFIGQMPIFQCHTWFNYTENRNRNSSKEHFNEIGSKIDQINSRCLTLVRF